MLKFLKYILIQDIEIDSNHKTFQVIHALIFLLISAFLSFGIYYLLRDYIKSNVIVFLLWIYMSLAFFTNQPAASVSQKKEPTDIKSWVYMFGFYNSLGVFIVPIYLMKYCLKEK